MSLPRPYPRRDGPEVRSGDGVRVVAALSAQGRTRGIERLRPHKRLKGRGGMRTKRLRPRQPLKGNKKKLRKL